MTIRGRIGGFLMYLSRSLQNCFRNIIDHASKPRLLYVFDSSDGRLAPGSGGHAWLRPQRKRFMVPSECVLHYSCHKSEPLRKKITDCATRMHANFRWYSGVQVLTASAWLSSFCDDNMEVAVIRKAVDCNARRQFDRSDFVNAPRGNQRHANVFRTRCNRGWDSLALRRFT